MARKYDERAVEATLTSGVNTTATTFEVDSTSGYPSPSGGDVASIVIDPEDPTKIEEATFTGRTATSFTGVTRGVGKNGAKAHDSGAKVRHAIPTAAAELIDDHAEDTDNPHEVTAAQAEAVALTGNQTIAGTKTFSSIPVLPASNPTTGNQASRKAFVDSSVSTVQGDLDTHKGSVGNHDDVNLSGQSNGQWLQRVSGAWVPRSIGGTTPPAIATSGAQGSSDLPARRDHTHAGVALSGNQTIAGVKTFSSIPVGPASNPTTDNQLVRKKFVDDEIAGVGGFDGTIKKAAGTSNSGTAGTLVAEITAAAGKRLISLNGVVVYRDPNTQVRVIVTYTDDTTTTDDPPMGGTNAPVQVTLNDAIVTSISNTQAAHTALDDVKSVKKVRVETLNTGTGVRRAGLAALEVDI